MTTFVKVCDEYFQDDVRYILSFGHNELDKICQKTFAYCSNYYIHTINGNFYRHYKILNIWLYSSYQS